MPEMTLPLIGDKFPPMEVQTTHGRMSLPGAYAGKWFVLFSHPGDFTPVCTTEFVAFQKRIPKFNELNTKLIGLSIDQVFSHIKWTDWIRDTLHVEIEFPIIAATEAVANHLGLIHPRKGTNTVRAVFIVDPNGTVRAILYYPQELGRNIDEIVRMIEGFHTAEKHKVALPANWPKNEMLGDHVIIPPPTDHAAAAARKGQTDCYDWWFCHKKV
ncbi:MAG: peroxiredoxin [Candidatus Bipolaricaulis sp.]|nr:peroxiredoxin [Candidatus Bipolaricaulis sp.]